MIPKRIHQTWATQEIPERWHAFHLSWQEQHPDYDHQLWTDSELRELVARCEPEFLEVYETFPRNIQRVDAGKAILMKHEGGVYADLDTECYQPITPLLETEKIVLSRTRDGVIDGAFMASERGHDYWDTVLQTMRHPPWYALVLKAIPGLQASYVLFSTGPFALRRALARYQRSGGRTVAVLDPRFCSNVSWWRRHSKAEVQPDTYVHHHYGDSWLNPLERVVVAIASPIRLLLLCAIAAVVWILANYA